MSRPVPTHPAWYLLDPDTIQYWDGERWVGDPVAKPPGDVPPPPPRFSGPPRKRRSRIGIAIAVVVGLAALGNLFEEQERRTTDLGPEQEGTQQAWIDYFDGADPAVESMNNLLSSPATATVQDLLDALQPLGESPDATLNRQVTSAVAYCEAGNAEGCFSAVDTVIDRYNEVLQDAEDAGLLEIIE